MWGGPFIEERDQGLAPPSSGDDRGGVELGLARMVSAAVLTAFWSRRVKAQGRAGRGCRAGRGRSGTSSGFWVTRIHADALERIRRTTCSIFSSRGFGASLKAGGPHRRKHQLGLIHVAHLRQLFEELGEHPQQEGGVQLGEL